MQNIYRQRTKRKGELIGLNFENKIAVDNLQIDKLDYATLLWLKNCKKGEARKAIHNGSSLTLSVVIDV